MTNGNSSDHSRYVAGLRKRKPGEIAVKGNGWYHLVSKSEIAAPGSKSKTISGLRFPGPNEMVAFDGNYYYIIKKHQFDMNFEQGEKVKEQQNMMQRDAERRRLDQAVTRQEFSGRTSIVT